MPTHPDPVRAARPRRPRRNTAHRERPSWIPAKYAVTISLVGAAVLAGIITTVYTEADAIPGLPSPAPALELGLPAVRVLLDLASVGTVGLSVLPRLVGTDRPAQTAPIMMLARRACVITALVWMLCALLLLVLQAAELAPGRSVTTTTVLDYMREVPAGTALVISSGFGCGCAVLGLLALRFGDNAPPELRTFLALLGLLPIPLTGHASDWQYHELTIAATELHVLAAALWTGGLAAVALLVAPRRGLMATTLPRLSRLATIAICTVAVTGMFNGMTVLITTPGVGAAGLVSTNYGRLLLGKVFCIVLAALLASHIRFRLMPRIGRHQCTPVVAWIAMELTVLGVAYGLGATLARAAVVA